MKIASSYRLIALSVVVLTGSHARADDTALAPEYDVKAAYLYNFAKFVEWPDSAMPREGEPFCIGVLGEDPFQTGLDRVLAGKTVQGHALTVKHFKDVAHATDCPILFVSRAECRRLASIDEPLRSAPVLTVGDNSAFSEKGGVVAFDLIGNRVRFNVNLKAAESARLKLSSQLLKVANVVRGLPSGEPQ